MQTSRQKHIQHILVVREHKHSLPGPEPVKIRLHQAADTHFLRNIAHLARPDFFQHIVFAAIIHRQQLCTNDAVVLFIQIELKLRFFRHIKALVKSLRRHLKALPDQGKQIAAEHRKLPRGNITLSAAPVFQILKKLLRSPL